LSKVRDLRSGPFDRLRANGKGELRENGVVVMVFGLRTHQPFSLSLSKVRNLSRGPFDRLRANGKGKLRANGKGELRANGKG
jgi:hypothetical protein